MLLGPCSPSRSPSEVPPNSGVLGDTVTLLTLALFPTYLRISCSYCKTSSYPEFTVSRCLYLILKTKRSLGLPDFLGPPLPLHISEKCGTWNSLRTPASAWRRGSLCGTQGPQRNSVMGEETQPLCIWKTEPLLIPPALSLQSCLPWKCHSWLGKARTYLLCCELLLSPAQHLMFHPLFLNSIPVPLTFCHFVGSRGSGSAFCFSSVLSGSLCHQWL